MDNQISRVTLWDQKYHQNKATNKAKALTFHRQQLYN